MKVLGQKWDPYSLKIRLTLGITIFSTLSLAGLASWISMKFQHIQVSTHKENIEYIAERFPNDVEIYSDMVPLTEGLERVVNNRTDKKIFLWVEKNQRVSVASSQIIANPNISSVLLNLQDVPSSPELREINGQYWLLCKMPLQVREENLGHLYIAQDITEHQTILMSLVNSLFLATAIALAIKIMAITFYINHSLRPLKRISQLTANVSVESLSEAKLHLKNPPSEVKELAETFNQMLVRLSQSWEHQRKLLSDVSHELRTPLTIICGYLESTLRRGNNLSEIQKEALGTAAGEANRTVQLLTDLLDLARADNGAIHFQQEKIVVNHLIAEIVMMVGQYSKHHIDFKVAPEDLAITADHDRLKQVLINLIDNAMKYSSPDRPIVVRAYRKGKSAVIEVCDHGVGIPLSKQDLIFERFYRLDEARNRSGGTGLGLSIAKTLVLGMGAKISVKSQPKKGSTFTLEFAQ